MLILHVHITGKNGAIERTYDFMRNDGKDTFEGVDVVIPYKEDITYPVTESDAMAIIAHKHYGREH